VQEINCGAWLRSKSQGLLVYWYPNGGNAGDHLIGAATDVLFRSNNIRYKLISDANNFDSNGKVILYGGGGCLIPTWTAARNFIKMHHRLAKRLVVLPHTINGNEDILGALGPNTTLICRDGVSFEHCQAAAPDAEILLADDLALSLKSKALLGWRITRAAIAEPKTYRTMLSVFRTFLDETRGLEELTVWRNDAERHPSRFHGPIHDISRMFELKGGNGSVNQLRISAHFFLSAINRFPSVITDRLHVAIGGAILGKQVRLYNNSYFKNRAVYELSLRSYPKVTFVDGFPEPACRSGG